MPLPGTYDLTLYQGDTWTQVFRFETPGGEPVDISTWTWAAQIRAHPRAAAAVTLTCTPGNDGVLTVELAAEDAAGLPATGVWDLQAADADGWEHTWLAGDVTVLPEVSRP